jgi:hypothetical protein
MTRERTFERTTLPNKAWVDLLRANCLTLVERPGVVNAVSVSRGFLHGLEEERDAVITLAQHMAGEYGLLAETDLRGHFLTIRFTRPAESQISKETSNGSSLFEKVRSLFQPGRESAAGQGTQVPEDERVPAEVRS